MAHIKLILNFKIMITREATKEVFLELLKSGEFQKAIDDDGDYVYISVSIFNAGSVANILSCDYKEETDQEAADNGELFIDKDDALRLLSEYDLDIDTDYTNDKKL